MDPAHQKTCISTPHMTENDHLNFWPPRPFDGLNSLRYYFIQKITSEMDPAPQKAYISTPHMTENDHLNFWLPRPFDGLQRPQ